MAWLFMLGPFYFWLLKFLALIILALIIWPSWLWPFWRATVYGGNEGEGVRIPPAFEELDADEDGKTEN